MLHSPDMIPLSEHERARVRRLHVILDVVKLCLGCGYRLPIDAFQRYGATYCGYCLDEMVEAAS